MCVYRKAAQKFKESAQLSVSARNSTELIGLGAVSGSESALQFGFYSLWCWEGEPLEQWGEEQEQLHSGQLLSQALLTTFNGMMFPILWVSWITALV